MTMLVLAPLLLTMAVAQQIGTHTAEEHPVMLLQTCTAGGCVKEQKSLTLDSNWRWINNGQYKNCYEGTEWDKTLCSDPVACSANCHLDGVSSQQYVDTYGVEAKDGGVKLEFVKVTAYGSNFGSRLYMMESEDAYKVFKLKNREFALTVDMSSLPCGLNGAVYFVEMDADGGKAKSGGKNKAGAKYGTGYCDAQCPHDLKFMDGEANVLKWNSTADPPVGLHGMCCAEMDIWEANSRATSYTPHPCAVTGAHRCEGVDCGDNEQGHRYDGVCDKDGCDFNSQRLGNSSFYGRSGDNFVLDSTQEMTVVTQFITSDGTDAGDLVDIRRFYVQGGKVVPNSYSSVAGVKGNSVTDELCGQMKTAFGDVNDFQRKGGLKVMGQALDRGMVLVVSLWDDSQSHMLWLDSSFPANADPSKPGVSRGPCSVASGNPKEVRAKYPRASVKYNEMKVGSIGSTFSTSSKGGDDYGGDRRLDATVHL